MKDQIKLFFKGDVEDSKETLELYSRDASIFTITPTLVLFPKDSTDIRNLVHFVNQSHPELSITMRAAGTCMSGGAIGESLIVDVSRYMNTLGDIGDDYAYTMPGVYYRDFEKATAMKGLMYPAYPASKGICAMGGIVGNNGAGEKTLHYGKAENYVRELSIIFSDSNEYIVKPLTKAELDLKIAQNDFEGSIYKNISELIFSHKKKIMDAKPQVSKNSAGYYLWNIWDEKKEVFDLTKLFTGSQGTLSIITNIKMGLVPIKKHSKLLVVFMHDLTNLGEIVNEARKLDPESIESYDDSTLKLAIRFWRGFIKKRGFFGFIKMGLSFIPEFFMILRGLPKLVLLIEFAGNDEQELKKNIVDLESNLSKYKLQTRKAHSASDVEKYWSIRRDSFALLREHVKGKKTAPFIEDIIVKPEFLPEFLPKLYSLLNEYPIEYTIAGHAGDGNFHIIPLMDFSKENTRDIILELGEKVYMLVKEYKGSITAEHNDGIVRTPYLYTMFSPEILELFKKTKDIFDPKNIFNPGKKVGGSIEYLKNHINH